MKMKLIFPLSFFAVVVIFVLWVRPSLVSDQAGPAPAASTEAAAPQTSASETPSPTPSCEPTELGTDNFTERVLKFEAANYLADAEARLAALAEVATPAYIAANPTPPIGAESGADFSVVIHRECTSVEWPKSDSTLRSVTVVNVISTFRGNQLVNGMFKDQPHTSLWEKFEPGGWKANVYVLR